MNSKDRATTRPTTGKTDATPKLRKPQIRILRVLADGRSRTKAQISKDTGILQWLHCLLGAHDEEVRANNDMRRYLSLLTLGLIRSEIMDVGGKDVHVYEITPKGRQVVTRLAAEKSD
jgi:hypothetical protein